MKKPKERSGDSASRGRGLNEARLFLFLVEESAQEGLGEEGVGKLEE